jgi:hypothetical protein
MYFSFYDYRLVRRVPREGRSSSDATVHLDSIISGHASGVPVGDYRIGGSILKAAP